MFHQGIALGDDLSRWAVGFTALICAGFVLRAWFEWRKRSRRHRHIVLVDLFSALVVAGAILRPCWVTAESTAIGARIAILVDGSRRLDLKSGSHTRRQAAAKALRAIDDHFSQSRLAHFEFGGSKLRWTDEQKGSVPIGSSSTETSTLSDLTGALEQLERQLGEKPAAVVVVSDGRLERPSDLAEPSAFVVPEGLKGTVLHTVDVGGRALPDASVLSVETSGNAVAHQAFPLEVTVGCFGGLGCTRVRVTVRELKKGVGSSLLASGAVEFGGRDTARVTFQLTIERAGSRVLEVAISSPNGDAVAENDSRMFTFQVLRERLRLLHVAGRPTYDVRALRNWLKSDTSVDLVSFFILRTDGDDTNTDEDAELALIPFPVDELFDEHLPSFDAVVLGDIDAERYRLSRYLGNLARYVEQGGGLILIGGQSAFSGGAYASSSLERVMPVSLGVADRPFDTVEFVPRLTSAGREAALLKPLRELMGDMSTSMPGANTFGPARGAAVVLWEHPSRSVVAMKAGGPLRPMPVLAVGEVGDGRVVALGVDGTHRLAFGSQASRLGGRAFGALWDGLLGWAIRDPRFEAAHGEILGECVATNPVRARINLGSESTAELSIEVERMQSGAVEPTIRRVTARNAKFVDVDLGTFPVGAYSALIRVGAEPAARFDFVCEAGGTAWADTRPDPKRLRRLAEANGGKSVDFTRVTELPTSKSVRVNTSRELRPMLPSWLWALLAAGTLAMNWMARRADGIA